MASVTEFLDQHRKQHLAQLIELLRIPSVSTDPARAADVKLAADWVRRRLREAGCTRSEIVKTERHPIVYGEWLGAPGAPTVLYYGHYDVQPPDPLGPWKTQPFEPVVRDEKIWARGASDDKGQFLVHVNALEAHLTSRGSCPVNVRFLIEGEEEISSPSLEPFLRRETSRLSCDSVVISDTAMFAKGVPTIVNGLRGLAYLEVHVRGSSRDLHSGVYGGSVANPALVLAQMLAALKDTRGRITVPGFYDRVRKLGVAERKAIAALPHSDERFKASIGAPELVGEKGFSTLERLWTRPSLDVNGIWGGFTGEGAKTVIPAEAHAKVSMRLVPDQNSAEIAELALEQLRSLAPPSVSVTAVKLHGGEPWLASTDHPALLAAGRALERTFGKKPIFVREGGSIPIVPVFEKLLGVPCVLMGFGLNDDNLHAPNEKLDLENFYMGMRAAAYTMEELGNSATRSPAGKRATAAVRS